MKKNTIKYGIVWISVTVAVVAAICFTKNANCLWAFALPIFVNFSDED